MRVPHSEIYVYKIAFQQSNMALVAYDYDSTSENEDEDEIDKNVRNLNVEISSVFPKKEIKVKSETPTLDKDLFSKLPQTKSRTAEIVEDQIEDFIPKSHVKGKQKVKITIPALSQFTDVNDEPEVKKLKSSVRGSGLISLLPPVKGSVITTKSFVPNAVAIKNQNDNLKASNTKSINSLVPNVIRKQADTKKSLLLKKIQQKVVTKNGSDIESDDDIDIPETFDDEMWEKVCGRPTTKQLIKEPIELLPQQHLNIAPEPEIPYEGLDNKAFKELVGKSKRPVGNIKLIDINEEEILAEKDLWMTKSLTDPEMAPKAQAEDQVDPTRRKKHHITYLAQQAKANEQELQNAWSASKNNRMATRAKYGF